MGGRARWVQGEWMVAFPALVRCAGGKTAEDGVDARDGDARPPVFDASALMDAGVGVGRELRWRFFQPRTFPSRRRTGAPTVEDAVQSARRGDPADRAGVDAGAGLVEHRAQGGSLPTRTVTPAARTGM